MAPLMYFGSRKTLLLSVLLFLFVSLCFTASSQQQQQQQQLSSNISGSRRRMLELEEQEFEQPLKKKSSTKNQTKLIKPTTNLNSSKNQTKTIKSNNNNNNISSSKNQTKLNSSKTTALTDTSLKKMNNNSTSFKTKKLNSTSKAFTNSTKGTKPNNSVSTSTKKSLPLDLTKTTNAKNKTTKATATKDKETKKVDQTESEKKQIKQSNKKQQSPPYWLFDDEDADLVAEFKDLPVKFQQTLIPDLERISTTSKAYITKANKEITKGFKPYVGNKYAPTIAVLLSCACVLIPLLFASLLLNKIKAYFSLQKLLIFIQAYLSIYFSILSLSSLVSGVEPLKFFYSTSQSTYICLQIIQTLAYVLYLLMLIMYLVLVFSTDSGLGSKFLGLAQTFVGFAVGLHYYMTVFHRVVLRQPPKTNWKVHGIYATCFFLICILARADRRKKTYLEEGGEEGKKN